MLLTCIAWDLGRHHVQCEEREETKESEREAFTNLKQVETKDQTYEEVLKQGIFQERKGKMKLVDCNNSEKLVEFWIRYYKFVYWEQMFCIRLFYF